MAARRRYAVLDVFTPTPLAGNPLAVVLDAENLDTAAMQGIAREFNLSETVFVRPPAQGRHRAALRIFTPATELPFAGHPVVGVAVLLAQLDRAGGAVADAAAFGLETGLGVVACAVEAGGDGRGEGGRARLKVPSLPTYHGEGPPADVLAGLLGLTPRDIGFGRHLPSRHEAGPRFTFVPLASRERLAAARLDAAALAPLVEAGRADALYLYAPEDRGPPRRFHARMFAPHLGVHEDPATGSAAAAFAGVLMQFEALGEGTHDVVLGQGMAMGRPSTIDLQITVESGALRSVEIGGHAVRVAEGMLLV